MAKYRYVGADALPFPINIIAGKIAFHEELEKGVSVVEGSVIPNGGADSDGSPNGTGFDIIEWKSNCPSPGALWATLPAECFELVEE